MNRRNLDFDPLTLEEVCCHIQQGTAGARKALFSKTDDIILHYAKKYLDKSDPRELKERVVSALEVAIYLFAGLYDPSEEGDFVEQFGSRLDSIAKMYAEEDKPDNANSTYAIAS